MSSAALTKKALEWFVRGDYAGVLEGWKRDRVGKKHPGKKEKT